LWSLAAMSVPLGQNSCLPPGTIRSQAEGGMRPTSKSSLENKARAHTHLREREEVITQAYSFDGVTNAIPAAQEHMTMANMLHQRFCMRYNLILTCNAPCDC